MTTLNSYELMLILRADAEDEARKAVLDRVQDIITSDDGAVGRVDEWGKRRFAYEIDHQMEGFYYVMYFSAVPSTLDEVTRVLKITDACVRFMPVRRDEDLAAVVASVVPEGGAEVPEDEEE